MKESDYINATNLAKTRVAKVIIGDIMNDEKSVTKTERDFLVRALVAWETRLEKSIQGSQADERDAHLREWPKP